MKSIAFIVNEFESSSEVFLYQLFEGLTSDFMITAYAYSLRETGITKRFGFSLKRLPAHSSFRFYFYLLSRLHGFNLSRNWVKDQYYNFLLIKVIKEKVVYFPFISMTRPFLQAIVTDKRKNIYTSVRGTDFTVTPYLDPSVLVTYQHIVPRLRNLHFLSPELFELSQHLEIHPSNYKIILQGVDFGKFHFNNNPPKDKLRILTVGRLHYIKGLEYSILAVAELKKHQIDFEFNIIGEGPEREKLTYQIHSLGLSDQVFLLGSMSREEVITHLQSSNVYVHTHLVNGISNTMLEALASNLRLVVFDSNLKSYGSSMLTELIREVPRFDVVAMAHELQNIAINKQYGNSERAVKDTLSLFSIEQQVAAFKSFFNK